MFSKASKDAKAGSKEIAPPAPVVPPQKEKPRVKQSNTMP